MLDTNVIISDPYVLNKIGDEIVIPYEVLMELDKFKVGTDEKARNVREFVRQLDCKIKEKTGKISLGKPREGENNDQKIINLAQEISGSQEVTLLTNDILMQIMATCMEVVTETHNDIFLAKEQEQYTGIVKEPEFFDLETAATLNAEFPNQYIVSGGKLERWTGEIYKSLGKDRSIWGIKHKNLEQRCAIDALMDDNIKLVTLSGKAGTGKTLLAIAAGLEKTISENKYRKLLVSRPVVPMGNDIGYLPGDINEKMGPWMQPIFDNLELLFDTDKKVSTADAYKDLENDGLMKIEALTYIRGRSIPQQYIIIDEAQNLTKHEVKTIISRVGEGTKIILTGDPDQIDNPRLDATNNGLSYVIEKFKDQKIAAHITLTKGERSELADIATKIL